jgi:hypothetical protein
MHLMTTSRVVLCDETCGCSSDHDAGTVHYTGKQLLRLRAVGKSHGHSAFRGGCAGAWVKEVAPPRGTGAGEVARQRRTGTTDEGSERSWLYEPVPKQSKRKVVPLLK